MKKLKIVFISLLFCIINLTLYSAIIELNIISENEINLKFKGMNSNFRKITLKDSSSEIIEIVEQNKNFNSVNFVLKKDLNQKKTYTFEIIDRFNKEHKLSFCFNKFKNDFIFQIVNYQFEGFFLGFILDKNTGKAEAYKAGFRKTSYDIVKYLDYYNIRNFKIIEHKPGENEDIIAAEYYVNSSNSVFYHAYKEERVYSLRIYNDTMVQIFENEYKWKWLYAD